MCGIAGIYDLNGAREINRTRLKRMTDALVHRGPDGEGHVFRPGLGLGHRRLAIIDLAGGAQPMESAAGRHIVSFNGEIYNYQDVRKRMEQNGAAFKTNSDTEALVEGWAAQGPSVLNDLSGMFAFALWDEAEDILHLVRDRLGEKPLYYTIDGDGFLLFASEVDALLAGLGETPTLNRQAVADYFAYGYVPDPKTIYEGVHKLPPGCRMAVKRGAALPKPQDYWRLQFSSDLSGGDDALGADLIDRLRGAVNKQMVSDVPLGAFLSGGVDSSAIVALMSTSGGAPITCSMGFSDKAVDETDYAARVAQQYETRHNTKQVEIDAVGLIDKIAAAYGEPFADNSALPTYLLCEMARGHVTVALSGDGADEILAGYRRYPFHLKEEQAKAFLPQGVRGPLFGALAAAYPKLDWAPRFLRAKATFEAMATDAAGGFFRALSVLPTPLRNQLFTEDFRRTLDGYDPASVLASHMADADTDDALARAQYADIKMWLAGRMLVKVDRASMAHSLEVRAPFLDPGFVEWCAQLPAAAKLKGFTGKNILKQALAKGYLPHDILYRQKQGFVMPVAAWMRGGLAPRINGLATSTALRDSGLINLDYVKRLAADHQSGAKDHNTALWALMMFDAFLKKGAAA